MPKVSNKVEKKNENQFILMKEEIENNKQDIKAEMKDVKENIKDIIETLKTFATTRNAGN